ncbi:MAG: nucleoside-triphosphatase [Armatimonadota bacterium]|nr:nucleoside-triphosphatase [Armatimonadota bacterium]MDR7484723.1 nucleoside-triphosphatase [Armatimonadota bacterium]MDR7531838.1 nucleoside-triphosphatase [Armatimonadota bacterium]MDR7534817.1 nucleoside-triphosphatase [Armatimonadota bacterium]
MGDVLLIAGRPGVGKTTLLRTLAADLGPRAGGFYTEEIREGDRRVGFRLVTLDGRAAVFAHVRLAARASYRVGRYGVEIEILERLGVASVREAAARGQVVLIDEIGKMELASAAFCCAVDEVADGPVPLVATVTLAAHPWADAFKRRPTVTLLRLTPTARDKVLAAARAWLAMR